VLPLTRLTSVHGSFHARVLAARLECDGIEVVLRGALDSQYALTVGELARIDVFVRSDQAQDASLALLVDEVDELDEVLDDDRPPIPRRRVPLWCVPVAAIMLAMIAMPVLHVVRDVVG
jgi:hypothetical protein